MLDRATTLVETAVGAVAQVVSKPQQNRASANTIVVEKDVSQTRQRSVVDFWNIQTFRITARFTDIQTNALLNERIIEIRRALIRIQDNDIKVIPTSFSTTGEEVTNGVYSVECFIDLRWSERW